MAGKGHRCSTVLALAIVAFVGASSGFAGELTPIIGTDVWLELPPGFAPIPEAGPAGFANRAAGASITASQTLAVVDMDLNLDELELNPDALARWAHLLPNGFAEVQAIGGQKFLISGGDLPADAYADGHIWQVGLDGRPMVTITFGQIELPGVEPVFDTEAVKQVLASVVVSRSQLKDAAAYAGGLVVPLKPPFLYPQLSETGGIRLRLEDLTKKTVGAPTISLQFGSPGSPAGISVERLASMWLGLGDKAELIETKDWSFVGGAALRQVWTAERKGNAYTTIGLVTVLGGQPVLFYLVGRSEQVTPAIVAAFDEIAGAVHPALPN